MVEAVVFLQIDEVPGAIIHAFYIYRQGNSWREFRQFRKYSELSEAVYNTQKKKESNLISTRLPLDSRIACSCEGRGDAREKRARSKREGESWATKAAARRGGFC